MAGENCPLAKQFRKIGDAHAAFMSRQRIFFVASSAEGGHVNVSPRGTDCFRTIDPTTVGYLDLTGSGNETAAHIRANGRVTIMFCALEGAPTILRLYGRGQVHGRRSHAFQQLVRDHFDAMLPAGARQIITLSVELVQTSCGYGVPIFDYRGERDTLDRWAKSQGEAGMELYRRKNNLVSLDGLPTGLLDHDRAESGRAS